MIPNRELEKVVKPNRETVIPVWEYVKKNFDSERDTLEEDQESCNLEKKWQESSRILDNSLS